MWGLMATGEGSPGRTRTDRAAVRLRAAWLALGIASAALVGLALVGDAISLLAPSTHATAMGAPHFVEEAAAAGIDHVYDGDYEHFVGGGVAVFDCDGDGQQDLYFAGGSRPAALYRNDGPVGGALRFTLVRDPATDRTRVTGAYPLDVDGDRRTDLAVLRLGENVLLRGLGDCRFERANETLAFDGGHDWTAAFSATWEGSAALPTLAFGNYLAPSDTGEPGDTCDDNVLIRPDPTGQGYGPALPLRPSWCSLSILFSDWARSGRRDLRASNDRHYYLDGEEQLWRIEPGKPPRLYTHQEGWQTLRVWGMGIASQDLTGDGLPEIYLTSQGDNKLQSLVDGPAQPRYGNIAIQRGVSVHRPFTGDVTLPSTGWHAEFQDVNNDSYMDLFVAKGNVEAMPDHAAQDPSNLLLGQPDGTFVESAEEAGILSFARGRGAALADFNLDGLLDLIEVNRRESVKLWRNVGRGDAARPAPAGHWIAVRLDQPRSNHDAIGAWVEVKAGDRTTVRELTVGGGHAGGQLGWIHFGLGSADGAEVRVQWPDGEWGAAMRVAGDTFAIIERGASEARPWQPQD